MHRNLNRDHGQLAHDHFRGTMPFDEMSRDMMTFQILKQKASDAVVRFSLARDTYPLPFALVRDFILEFLDEAAVPIRRIKAFCSSFKKQLSFFQWLNPDARRIFSTYDISSVKPARS